MHENILSTIHSQSIYSDEDESERFARVKKLDFEINCGSQKFNWLHKDGQLNDTFQFPRSETKEVEPEDFYTKSKKNLSKTQLFRQGAELRPNPFPTHSDHEDEWDMKDTWRYKSKDDSTTKTMMRSYYSKSPISVDTDARARKVNQHSGSNYMPKMRSCDFSETKEEADMNHTSVNPARVSVRYSKSNNFHRYIQFRVLDMSKTEELQNAVECRMPHPLQRESPGCSISSSGLCTVYYSPSASGAASGWINDVQEWVSTDLVMRRLGVKPTDLYFTEVRPDIITA